MSEADKAYAEAERLIEEARRNRVRALDLSTARCRQLNQLPPSITELTELVSLDLSGSNVSDIRPLSTLKNLNTLDLYNLPVSDLRPLLKLTRLAKEPSVFGITIENTLAYKQDPNIARTELIREPDLRAKALFDYLKDWEPPTPPNPTEQDVTPTPATPETNAITIPQLRAQFQANRPEFSSRLEHLMALVQQEQAVHNLIPIPNEEAAKAEYDAKSGFLSVVGAELIALRDELPQDFARQLSEDEAKGLKTRLVKLAELTDTCIKHLDKDHGTYGGLYKIGLITAVAGLLSVIPGLNMIASTALAGGVLGVQTVRLHIGKDDD